MAILRRRPNVSVKVPSVIQPGGEFVAEITLDAKAEVPVEWVDAGLEGKEEVRFGQGKNTVRYKRSILRLGARLMEEVTLPQGKKSMRCQFALPAEMPPSYRGTRAECEYTLRVRVSIPWWPDRKSEFDIVVRPPIVTPPEDPQATFASHPNGPAGDEPAFECSLDRRVLEPNATLQGMVALSNTAYHRVRQLSIALVSMERIRSDTSKRTDVNEAERFVMKLAVPETIADGEAIPFRMRIPERIAPSWRSGLWDLDWYVEVESHVAWTRNVKVMIPVIMVPQGSAKAVAVKAPPRVGSERIAAVWRVVGRELGMEFEQEALSARVQDTEVVIRRDHRGSEGIFLIAELRYPSLHLGLDGGLKRGFRRILGGGVSVGDEAWDKRHYVAAREPAQAESFVRAAGASLASVDVHDIDDEHAVVQRRQAGLTVEPLREFAQRALALAGAIHGARAQIPPPACMASAEEAWRAIAVRLDGVLETSRMAVVGRMEGEPVEVATTWGVEPVPLHTVLHIALSGVPREEQRVAWEAGRFTSSGPEGLPEPCRDLLDALLKGAVAFRVDEREVVLTILAPALEAAPLIELLTTLRSFAAGLRVGAGPYR